MMQQDQATVVSSGSGVKAGLKRILHKTLFARKTTGGGVRLCDLLTNDMIPLRLMRFSR